MALRTRPFQKLATSLKTTLGGSRTARKAPSSFVPPTSQAILEETKRLLNMGWIRGSNAARADGLIVPFISEEACAFCLQGAFHRASFNLQALCAKGTAYEDARAALVKSCAKALKRPDPCGAHVWIFNDSVGRTHSEVLAVVTAAKATL